MNNFTETVLGTEIITRVKLSYGRALLKGDLIDRFYDIFLVSHPEIKPKFSKTNFEQQKGLLKHGINLMISFAGKSSTGMSGLTRIQQSHSIGRMNIEPKFYTYWGNSLLKAISEFDPEFSDSLKEDWRKVLRVGIEFIISGYKK